MTYAFEWADQIYLGMDTHTSSNRPTHGDKMLHTLLVKRFNDLLDEQKSQRSIDKVTYFYVGDPHHTIFLTRRHLRFRSQFGSSMIFGTKISETKIYKELPHSWSFAFRQLLKIPIYYLLMP